MRTVLVLALVNALVWGASILLLPGSHFAWPGSYKFWWFDDVPWAALTLSAIATLAILSPRLKKTYGFKGGSIVILATASFAVLPYVTFSEAAFEQTLHLKKVLPA